jgi:hypothetical protein
MVYRQRSLRLAIVAIAHGDTALRAIVGRDTGFMIQWNSMRLDGPFPVIAFLLDGFSQTGESDDNREGEIRFSVFAQGPGAQEKVDAIMERLEALYTWNAFDAQGCDAAPMVLHTDDGPEGEDHEGTRGLERGDLRISITHTVEV